MPTKLPTPAELIALLREAKVKDFELVNKELKKHCLVKRICNKKDVFIDEIVEIEKSGIRLTNGILEIHGDIKFEDVYEILGTPPSMQRVLAFLFSGYLDKRNGNPKKTFEWFCENSEESKELLKVWLKIDTKGLMNFFELIKNAKKHYEELYNFCKSYIL